MVKERVGSWIRLVIKCSLECWCAFPLTVYWLKRVFIISETMRLSKYLTHLATKRSKTE